MWVYINGEFFRKEDAKISVFDHGLLYGDGVFEGIRSYNGRVFKLWEHVERLYKSAHVLMLPIPYKKEEMVEAVLSTVRMNNLQDAYIRLIVTRGEGDLGLDPRKCTKPNIIIIADKIILYSKKIYDEGLHIVTVATRRNIPEALNPCLKSLNYLNNILAKIEANNADAAEALMLNIDGFVTECTGENIFILKDTYLLTPPSYVGALEGITRMVVMEIAKREGIYVKEEAFTRYELYNAKECFLTGTAAEVVPVTFVDGRAVGDGKVGEVTRMIMKAFRELTQSEGVPVYDKVEV
jgi:branched-chain amino acid aminotransferase